MTVRFQMLLKVGVRGKEQLQAIGNSMQGLQGRVKNLKVGVRELVGAFAALQAVRGIADLAVNSIESERRLKALSGVFGEVAEAQAAAARQAEKFGLSQTEANKSFAQIYARLRPIGIELRQIESAYAGFNTAARLSGTSAQEASAAWLQLSQALGSGVLRGEELNSVFEQTPTVVQAIAREMNAPIGKIRDLAKEGKISSDVVLSALNKLETDGVDQLAEAMDGPAQRIKDFQNSLEEGLLAFAPFIDLATKLLSVFNDLPDAIKTGTIAIGSLGVAAGVAGPSIKAVAVAIGATTAATGIFLAAGAGLIVYFGTLAYEIGKAEEEVARFNKVLSEGSYDDVYSEVERLTEEVREARIEVEAASSSFNILDLILLDFGASAEIAANKVDRLEEALQKAYNNEKLRKQLSIEDLAKFDNTKQPEWMNNPNWRDEVRKSLDFDPWPTKSEKPATRTRGRGRSQKEETGVKLGSVSQSLESWAKTFRGLGDMMADLLEQREEQLDKSAEALTISKAELAIMQEMDPIQKIVLDTKERIRVITRETAEALTASLSREEQQNIVARERIELTLLQIQANDELKRVQEESMSNFDRLLIDYGESIGDFSSQAGNLVVGAFEGMEDALTDFVMTGKANFADLARSIIADMTRIAIRQAVLKPILGLFNRSPVGGAESIGLLAADGATFANGIVNSPTIFRYANGGAGRFGLMGEAGPEAILPLRRGGDGRLGVEMNGGGSTSVVVNVDARGSSVDGDSERSRKLGRQLSAAIQSELIKQKRPGGLLN